MELKLLKLLGSEDYVPSNVPELLCQLGMKPNQQQVLQSLHEYDQVVARYRALQQE